jgi:hypothetical protein
MTDTGNRPADPFSMKCISLSACILWFHDAGMFVIVSVHAIFWVGLIKKKECNFIFMKYDSGFRRTDRSGNSARASNLYESKPCEWSEVALTWCHSLASQKAKECVVHVFPWKWETLDNPREICRCHHLLESFLDVDLDPLSGVHASVRLFLTMGWTSRGRWRWPWRKLCLKEVKA